MSVFKLDFKPGGAGPNLDMTLKMQKPGTGGPGPGTCQKAFAGYAVTGQATFNVTESGTDSTMTWNWPCGSNWEISIVGFGIPCGGTYSWSHQLFNAPTLGSHLVFTETIDEFGNPALNIDGDTSTCDDTDPLLQVQLLLDGDTNFGTLLNFRPSPAPITLQYDGTTVNVAPPSGFSESWDGSQNLVWNIFDYSAAFNLTANFEAIGSSGSVTWTVDTSLLNPGWSAFFVNFGTNIQITVDYDGSSNVPMGFLNFYGTDDLDGRFVPAGSGGSPGTATISST